MKGELLIDGIDVFETYGASISANGLNSVLSYPTSKSVVSNDWHEEDGIEVDLSQMKLNRKEYTIPFIIQNSLPRVESFLDFMMLKPYRSFQFKGIGLTRVLRIIGHPSESYNEKFTTVTVKVSEDTPLQGFTYTQVSSTTLSEDNTNKLDGTPLSSYGIRILEGSYNEVLKRGDLKTGIVRDVSTIDGVIADDGAYRDGSTTKYQRLRRRSTQFSIRCLLTAKTTEEAWRNYFGFLYDLVRPVASNGIGNECRRTLLMSGIGKTVQCYYDRGTVTDFDFNGSKVWLMFTLTMIRID